MFGVGVDLCNCSRVLRVYQKYSQRFLRRAFHPAEIQQLESRCASDREAASFLGSRWAAKEAVFKAFGTKRLPFTDIEVVSIGAGMKPTIRLHGEGEREAARLGVSGLVVDMSGGFLATGGSRQGEVVDVPDWGKTTDPYQKTATSTLGRTGGSVIDDRITHIPGYTGFIKNGQEVAGRSYSRAVARALSKTPAELVAGDMIPTDPHATHKITPTSPSTTTTLVGAYQSKVRHVPGYTGHVPDVKNAVGKTYGSATEDLVSRPIDAKVDRKTLKKASLDAYAVPTSPQRPALDLDTTGLYLKYR